MLRRAWDFRGARIRRRRCAGAEAVARIGWPRVQRTPGSAVGAAGRGMGDSISAVSARSTPPTAPRPAERDGAASGIVNLGGDLRVLGPGRTAARGRSASSIRAHPERTIASIRLARGALRPAATTSGSSKSTANAIPHPEPGHRLAVQGWQSISVVAPLCVAAGAMSTIALLHEDAAAVFWPCRSQQVAWLGVDRDGRVRRGLPV